MNGFDEEPSFRTRVSLRIEHLVVKAICLIGIEQHPSTPAFLIGRRCRKVQTLYRERDAKDSIRKLAGERRGKSGLRPSVSSKQEGGRQILTRMMTDDRPVE